MHGGDCDDGRGRGDHLDVRLIAMRNIDVGLKDAFVRVAQRGNLIEL